MKALRVLVVLILACGDDTAASTGGRADAGPGTDASMDAAADVAADAPEDESGCDGEGFMFPSRPEGADTSGDEQVFGLHGLTLSQSGERWQTIGRNLDGLCSMPPTPLMECQPREESVPQEDGESGIDNAFGASLFELLSLIVPELDEAANTASRQGTGALILRVRGYNGEADDPSVEVAVLQSVYGFAGTSAETEPSAHEVIDFGAYELDGVTRKTLPAWDGNDWLFPRADGFSEGDLETPLIVTSDAYVAAGVLVVALPDNTPFNLAAGSNGLRLALSDARLAVGIADGNELSGRAQLSGRWQISEILESTNALGVCPSTPEYDIFTREIDAIADVLSLPGDDDTMPCDAVSTGVEWDISRARLGVVATAAELPTLCE